MEQVPKDAHAVQPIDLTSHLSGLSARGDAVAAPLPAQVDTALSVERPDEMAALGVGLLMLERLVAHGGSPMPMQILRSLRERLIRGFAPADAVALEVEAYRCLSWAIGLPEVDAVEAPPALLERGIEYDPEAPPIDVIRRAIAEGFDLQLHYYTQGRGELNSRRVTPQRLEAERYLYAYCHVRQAERRFRLSRIGEIRPVMGIPRSSRSPLGRQGKLDL